ncbi:MAG: DUF4019 domain-containing protein [Parachlamydiaceae bacterium]|nr:DUF4019 domain-containing protein [Parachlamydiaceae bacterium]
MKKLSIFFLAAMGPFLALQAEVVTTSVPTTASAKPVLSPEMEGQLQAGEITTNAWLNVVDKGDYSKSWEEMSSITRNTVKKDEWEKILTKTRKPLGGVKKREVVDIRSAINPKNLPAGNYMVMVYKTSFATKSDGHELVTLFLQDGQWHVLTYQID